MSSRLDALRIQVKRHRFATERDCVRGLCAASFPHGAICSSLPAWEEMLTEYAYIHASRKWTSVVKAWFFVLYRLNRVVPDPTDELAGVQLAAKMWDMGLRSPDAKKQETLLEYLFDELCLTHVKEADTASPQLLYDMTIHLSMRLQELGAVRLATTSHGERLPEDFSESLWGAADGVIALWEKVDLVSDEYEKQTGGDALPDDYVGYIVQMCFIDYLWIFMAADRAEIEPQSMFKLISRFPHEAKWQTLFQRLMDEQHFDQAAVDALLECEVIPSDARMEEAAECVLFWRNETFDIPLHHYLSNYLTAEAVG